jgi:hypothetical protein
MDKNLSYDNHMLSNKLKEYFKDNIKFSMKTENRLFIVTKKDIFYEINTYDKNIPLLISNNDDSVLEKMIVEELSCKEIIDISHGNCHYIARSIDDRIYCWGNNFKGQLANGLQDEDLLHFKKPELNKMLSFLNIHVIKCGAYHSLALTRNGEMYTWGNIHFGEFFGIFFGSNACAPIKLKAIERERIVMISCGFSHSMALTEKGRVLSWGDNGRGQLGIGKYTDKPKVIKLSVTIVKISCGFSHNLLLSHDGVIYSFGQNYYGQIGNGTQKDQPKPFKLKHEKIFIDIATHYNQNISVSLSCDNIYFVWGECCGRFYTLPTETRFESFDEIFINYFGFYFKNCNEILEFSDLPFRNGFYKEIYNEIDCLGKGGYGTVFKANMKNNNKSFCAVKKINFNKDDKWKIFKEFHIHSTITRLLDDYVVRHEDVWLEYDTDNEIILYIKMELCDKTLEKIIDELESNSFFKNNGTLTPVGYCIASQIFIKLLECVQYLHEHNIIHRDLNPMNIMIRDIIHSDSYNINSFIKIKKVDQDSKSMIRIVDFGLISMHEYAEETHTQDVGNIKYMAPEVDNNLYNTKADIYSLGIVLKNLFDIDMDK